MRSRSNNLHAYEHWHSPSMSLGINDFSHFFVVRLVMTVLRV